MVEQTNASRKERQSLTEVLTSPRWGPRSRDGLTTTISPSITSVMTGAAVGKRRDVIGELASSQLPVPEPVLYNQQQVLDLVDESLDCNNGEYEGNDGRVRRVRRVMTIS